MSKASILKYLVISILCYYLVKGAIYLTMWQALVKMEQRGKERVAKQRKAIEEMRARRTNKFKPKGWE